MQSYVWLNWQAFSKIMKKCVRFCNPRPMAPPCSVVIHGTHDHSLAWLVLGRYDKHMGYRGTDKVKSADFDKRLETEPFKNKRLDALLEEYREAKARQPGAAKAGGTMEMRLLSGSANPALSEELAARLGVPLTGVKLGLFNDGECNITIQDSVRGADVFIIQPTCPPVNDNLMQLLLLISACRRASAARVTAVVPYYGYARQDRKDRARVPISAADVARMIEAMGVDRVCCVDLHCGQIQGFFGPRTPVDNLYVAVGGCTHPLGTSALAYAHAWWGLHARLAACVTPCVVCRFAGPIALSYFQSKKLRKVVVVSPDAGGVARAKTFLEGLASMGVAVSLAVIIKQRPAAGEVGTMNLVGSVDGCDCIIVDDMIDTAGTLCKAADELREFGANRIFAFATHGLFNGSAGTKIQACALEEVVVANTVGQNSNSTWLSSRHVARRAFAILWHPRTRAPCGKRRACLALCGVLRCRCALR